MEFKSLEELLENQGLEWGGSAVKVEKLDQAGISKENRRNEQLK